ncbi:MAG: hypothetical protein JWL85_216 [Candidatus Saccharibacteria bacterium]|nr:hypothetical protein [Candidatus Saccharibacteria bacterium]
MPRYQYGRRSLPSWKVIAVATGLIIGGILIGISLNRQGKVDGKEEMRQVVQKVSVHYLLPGEEPTLATVSDKSKLSKQIFFKPAENGDKILFYEKSKIVIIYRPNVDKIVSVGPLVVDSQDAGNILAKIAVRNGTNNNTKHDELKARIASALPNSQLVEDTKAVRDFPQTIVVDPTGGKNKALAEQVADLLGLKTGQMPLGEKQTSADVLIITGTD